MSLQSVSNYGASDNTRHPRWVRVSTLALCISAALASCSSPEVIDDSPIVRSATIVSSVTNGGMKGQFASSGARTVKTVEDMRREDEAFKFTGGIMSRLGGSGDASNIVRLDRGAIYRLDNKRKTYEECPITGCPSFLDNLTQGRTYGEEQERESVADECQISTLENDLTIERTGIQREISGFSTDEYLFRWSIVMQDPDGKQMRSEITSQTWTTPITGVVAQALQMNDTYDQAYVKASGKDYPENLRKVMPADALEVMSTYLLDAMSDADTDFVQKLAAIPEIQGYPISNSIEWQMSGQTCATPEEPEEENEDVLDTGSFGGLLSSIGRQVVNQEIAKKKEEKLREIALEPIFSYVETVDSIAIEDLRSSKLDVPAGYKLAGRR